MWGGSDYESKLELVDHWRANHIRLPDEEKEGLGAGRVEEEVRKRLFWEEAMNGPFEIRGQEHRRVVGAHATHQTHSCPGTGCINSSHKEVFVGRQLSGCAICARSMWLEDLYEMDLFTKPASDDVGAECVDDTRCVADHMTAPGLCPEAVGEHTTRRCRFKIDPHCVSKVNKLLSAHEYSKRWPRIPKHELWASSVQHPHVPSW